MSALLLRLAALHESEILPPMAETSQPIVPGFAQTHWSVVVAAGAFFGVACAWTRLRQAFLDVVLFSVLQ